MPFLPYLDTPTWARRVINILYTAFYGWIIAVAFGVIAAYSYIWLDLSMVLGIGGSTLAIISVWRRTPDWEWGASIFVIGAIFTYLVVQWYEALTGATNLSPLLDASTGAGALFMLSARSVLLYVAVQKNKVYAQLKE